MGEWNLASAFQPISPQDYLIDFVIIHERFDEDNAYANNIALLKLKTMVPLGATPTVGTACLPSRDISSFNLRCVVSGFGRESRRGDDNFIMRDIDQPLINSTQCQTMLRRSILGGSYRHDARNW
jgi:hypothetical protein